MCLGVLWFTRTSPEGGARKEPLQARLRAISLRKDALPHLDYHPLNVRTDATGLTAVLGWADARAGDPRADLVRSVTILRRLERPL